MYQTKVSGDRLYHAKSQGYGESIELFAMPEDGDTPMSLVVIALGACVTMCIQGYYKRIHAVDVLPITIETSFESNSFHLTVQLPEQLDKETELALRRYIDRNCNVKKVLRQDLIFNVHFTYTEEF